MTNLPDPKNRKPSSGRSARFPAYTLDTAIETVREARKFGKTVTDAQLAGNGSVKSGAFIRKKAALGYYGLIAGRSADVHLTDLAEAILYPKQGEEQKAIREAFLAPEIFKKLYSTATKNIPIALSAFGNILIRDYNIQPSVKNSFLSIFIKSGALAGLIKYSDDTKSDIIFLDENENKEIDKDDELSDSSKELTPVYAYDQITSPELQTVELILTNGKAKIVVPKDLTLVDVKRLKMQISLLANIIEDE